MCHPAEPISRSVGQRRRSCCDYQYSFGPAGSQSHAHKSNKLVNDNAICMGYSRTGHNVWADPQHKPGIQIRDALFHSYTGIQGGLKLTLQNLPGLTQ